MPIGTHVLFLKTVVGMLMLPPCLVGRNGNSPVPNGNAFFRPARSLIWKFAYRPPAFSGDAAPEDAASTDPVVARVGAEVCLFSMRRCSWLPPTSSWVFVFVDGAIVAPQFVTFAVQLANERVRPSGCGSSSAPMVPATGARFFFFGYVLVLALSSS
eukprot:CAMPEP_0178986470 /NCGR_PEP_ID=MMETSP0795-20121207/2718_1 /TAXON_ID=88552 /ORGANISM="Amoebophrya sp., Strain Ameob2" /LENGTH=156 /DNA_ID=CAMNT_0020677527 /DNA_START=578 /DNA_END=1051 /DNA_ORIENTATION=-